MTIRNRELNTRLGYVERCAEVAPEGTYQNAKNAAAAIAIASNGILEAVRGQGFKALNDDRLRDLEAAIYGYLCESNPDAFADAEGFGEHIDGEAGDRIMQQTKRDRDFLRAMRAI